MGAAGDGMIWRYCGAPSFAHGALIAFLESAVLLILGSVPVLCRRWCGVSGYLLVGPIHDDRVVRAVRDVVLRESDQLWMPRCRRSIATCARCATLASSSP